MYCTKCGALLKATDKYCEECGNSLKRNDKPKQIASIFRNKKTILVFFVFLFVVIAIVAWNSIPRNELKYSWGTSMKYIEEQEYTLEHFDYRNVLKCDDPHHTVDKLDFIDIKKDYVYYHGEETNSLKSISYTFSEEMGYAERIEKLKEFYGNKYFVTENSEPYYSDVIWVKGDTVIIVSYGNIKYYDKVYFFEKGLHFSDEVIDEMKSFFDVY